MLTLQQIFPGEIIGSVDWDMLSGCARLLIGLNH